MERTTALTPPEMIETDLRRGRYADGADAGADGAVPVLRTEVFPRQSRQIEYSMEANPGTVDEEKLAVMMEGGVNRSASASSPLTINCSMRSAGSMIRTMYTAVSKQPEAGFTNLSIDLMFGLPNQTLEQLDRSVTLALELDLPHYSIYSLKVEENTLFYKLYQRDELPLPDEDTEYAMYLLIMDRFVKRDMCSMRSATLPNRA